MNALEVLARILPAPILRAAREHFVKTHERKYKGLDTDELFERIYFDRVWGKPATADSPYYSGNGSHNSSVSSAYIEAVREFLTHLETTPDAVDLGCGDFSIGLQLRPVCGSYIACDIVPGLVAHNRARHANAGVEFRTLDMTQDELPHGDIVFIRQVLQHLSNAAIARVVAKLPSAYTWLVLTEHLPSRAGFTPNLDMPSGPGTRLYMDSGIVLTEPPFNLPTLETLRLCEVPDLGGVIRTNAYRLN